MTSLTRALTLVAGLALAFSLVACGSDSDSTPPVDISGTYSLISLNGAPIPAFWGIWSEDGEDLEAYVTTASVQLGSDRTLTFTASVEFRLAGVVVETEGFDEAGTWELVGSDFRAILDAGTIPGSVSGRTLTMLVPPDNTIPASVWVFER